MFRTALVGAALSVGLSVATASAANPPFGGDDTGFVPPAKSDTAKCEAKASKAAAKLVACIIKCHDSRASGKLADDTAEEACEKTLSTGKSCSANFATAIAKLKGCPTCINATSMAALAVTAEALVDASNGSVYCDGAPNPPFGGDDTGFVPPAKSATAKCEGKVSKAAAKLVACIFKCHDSRGSGKLEDAAHEEECETTDDSKSCRAKFLEATSTSKLKGCPACINSTTMTALDAAAEGALDASNGAVYCASPSGAFVD